LRPINETATSSTEKKTKKKKVEMVATMHYGHCLQFAAINFKSAPHLKA
jgi:hypothetical protein